MDAKNQSDYCKPMSSIRCQSDKGRRGRFESLGRGLVSGTLAALPLCGLICFFEITRPAPFHGDGIVATELSNTVSAGAASTHGRRYAVAHLNGVSAEVGQSGPAQPYVQVFSASDAERAFAGAPYASLKAGFQTEFVTKERRRVALRIVSREPIVDRALPDTSRLMHIVPASTANVSAFVWGPWLYRVEVEDRGLEPEIVVQKVL